MSIILQRVGAALIGGLGLLVVAGYALALVLMDNRDDATQDWGGLAGFGLFAAVLAALWFVSTLRRRTGQPWTFRLPPLWLSAIVFAATVGGGFGLMAAERGTFVAPALAVLAFLAVAAFFLRLASRWLPGRRAPGQNVVLPGLWGALIAPAIIMVLQGLAAVVLIAAAVTGFYVDNPDFEFDPNLNDRISEYIEESEDDATSTTLPDVVARPTIALALFVMLAVIAPLSEELIKALGAIIVLARRAAVTRADAYIAGVAAGLGFGVLEGIGYTLMAPSSWQQVIIIRAPVVVLHVAATTIVTVGWFRMRESGRGFLPYFGVAVLLHAAWNSMSLGFVMSLTGLEEGADPSGGRAAAIGLLILMLGVLFVAACAWVVLSARKAGTSEPDERLDAGQYAGAPQFVQSQASLG